jgi:hypothetical protein
MQNIPHSKTTFANHLTGTYNILKSMNMPQDVRIAGLFHAIYGTESFSHNQHVTRDDVKNMIGEYAEDLVYTFCAAKNRTKSICDGTISYDKVKTHHLACIEYANLLEQSPRINITGLTEVRNAVGRVREI